MLMENMTWMLGKVEAHIGYSWWSYWGLSLSVGHVGAPLPCNLIKLVDVAEKNYFAAKGEGEVRYIHYLCIS